MTLKLPSHSHSAYVRYLEESFPSYLAPTAGPNMCTLSRRRIAKESLKLLRTMVLMRVAWVTEAVTWTRQASFTLAINLTTYALEVRNGFICLIFIMKEYGCESLSKNVSHLLGLLFSTSIDKRKQAGKGRASHRVYSFHYFLPTLNLHDVSFLMICL